MTWFTADVLLNIVLSCAAAMFVLGVALAAWGAWILWIRPDDEEGPVVPWWHPDHPQHCTDDTAWRDFEVLTADLPEPRRPLGLRRRHP